MFFKMLIIKNITCFAKIKHAFLYWTHLFLIQTLNLPIMLSCYRAIVLSYHRAIVPSCHRAIVPSCHRTIVPSCRRAIVLSCLHAFRSILLY